MKPNLPLKKILFTFIAVFSIGLLNAQEEKSNIHIKIEKDGKVIKDTVYAVSKDTDPEIVSKIIDMSLSEKGQHRKVMAFKSEDGKLHEIHGDHDMMLKEMDLDDDGAKVFVTTEEGENGETKVIVKKIYNDKDGEKELENREENVYIIKSNDGDDEEVYEIKTKGEKPQWIEKDGDKILIIDTKDGKSKNIKIIEEGKDGYSYETEEGETIMINSSKGDKEKEIKVEVVIEDKKADVDKEVKKIKKKKNK